MKYLIQKNYDSIVKRGLITPDTNAFDFLDKIKEETLELEVELNRLKKSPMATKEHFDRIIEELADVILTALNFAKHFDVDIEKEMISKIQINATRVK